MKKLLLLSVCALLIAIEAPAAAEDLPQLPASHVTLAEARKTLVAGDFHHSREILASLANESTADAAAARQLTVVLAEWEKTGRPLRPRRPYAPVRGGDWIDKLRGALVNMVDGWYAPAAKTFDDLVDTAPDATSRTVASELRSLAIEAQSYVPPSTHVFTAPPPPADDETPIVTTKKQWYGWQTLVVDGISLLTAPAYCLGCIGYVVGAPIVHAAHGRWGAAGGSLGLRVAAPIGLGLGFYALAGDDRSSNRIAIGAAGFVIGIATAIAVDAAVLARKEAEPPKEAFWKNARPSIEPRREGGVALGLSGTF